MDKVREPAGWDINSIIDYRGVAIFVKWLASDSKHRFWPAISSNDKTPNFDGHVEFGERRDKRIVPVGRVHVQVKSTTSLDEISCGDLHFSCKTEVFSAVSHRITNDPAALVVVDVVHERCFWKDLTQEYIDSLDLGSAQQKKTVYLETQDVLTDHDAFYCRLWLRYREHQNRLTGVHTGGVITASKVGVERLSELQRAYRDMTNKLTTTLRFLKELSFLDTWTISLGYGEIPDGYVFAIIPVTIGEDGLTGVRDIGLDMHSPFAGYTLTGNIHTDPPLSRVFSSSVPIAEAMDSLLIFWVEQFARTQVIPPRFMSDVMLSETMFFCGDLIAQQTMGLISNPENPNLFVRDSMEPWECRWLYNACYRSAVDVASELSHGNLAKDLRFYVELFGVNAIEDVAAVSRRIADYYNSAQHTSLDGESCVRLQEQVIPFSLMRAVVEEVERRELVVKRPWRCSSSEELRVRDLSLLAGRLEGTDVLPFDKHCTRTDYIENYEALLRLAHTEALDIEAKFFGTEQAWDEHAHTTYRLHIDDCCAMRSYARYHGASEGYELEVLPLGNGVEDAMQPITCTVGGTIHRYGWSVEVPVFIGHRPLYNEVLRRILNLVALKCPEARLDKTSINPECGARRVTLADGHVLMSGGLTSSVDG